MPSSSRLVLFDIDGTLMSTGQAGRQAIKEAMEEVFGTPGPARNWVFAGKTDPQICYEVLGAAGWEREAVDARLEAFWPAYLSRLARELPRSPRCHLKPGVEALLQALAPLPEAHVGLLTGNVREGARIKLDRFNLFHHFAMGAFGSDAADRHALPAIAVERAHALWNRRFIGKEVVIIGDTAHDVLCGQSLGVKAIGVATGTTPVEELRRHGADHCFEDLRDTERVLAAILD